MYYTNKFFANIYRMKNIVFFLFTTLKFNCVKSATLLQYIVKRQCAGRREKTINGPIESAVGAKYCAQRENWIRRSMDQWDIHTSLEAITTTVYIYNNLFFLLSYKKKRKEKRDVGLMTSLIAHTHRMRVLLWNVRNVKRKCDSHCFVVKIPPWFFFWYYKIFISN